MLNDKAQWHWWGSNTQLLSHKHSTTKPLRCLNIKHDQDPNCLKFCNYLFGLVLYVPVNSYGHVETVSLPNPGLFLYALQHDPAPRIGNFSRHFMQN